MSKPIVSFAGDGFLPAGPPKITFLEIPARPYVCEDFNADHPTNDTDRTDELGHYAGGTLSLGKRTGSATLELNGAGDTAPVPGCTFVYEWQGVAYGWVVTQVGNPRSKDGEVKCPISFREVRNPLIMVPVGDYTFTQNAAIDDITFAVNARHTVPGANWAVETDSLLAWRPLEEDRESIDCDDALPTGLAISAGVLSGTPTAVGTTHLRIRATSDKGRIGWRDIKITVEAAG